MTVAGRRDDREVTQAVKDAAAGVIATRALPLMPVRQKSAGGIPKPDSHFERTCAECGAAFMGLLPGKTGERGLWTSDTGLRWYCSQECKEQ